MPKKAWNDSTREFSRPLYVRTCTSTMGVMAPFLHRESTDSDILHKQNSILMLGY